MSKASAAQYSSAREWISVFLEWRSKLAADAAKDESLRHIADIESDKLDELIRASTDVDLADRRVIG
ncbi:MAG: hypothetical protein FLDDKLPJ_00015 [Phycisphaerae bacterium]|nr:hypothetical protein [Phycisphaerae bacterium]